MRIALRVEHAPTFPFIPVNSDAELYSIRSNLIKDWERLKNTEKRSLGKGLSGLDDLMTTMEPISLHIHLDDTFVDRNRVTLVNHHKIQPKLTSRKTYLTMQKSLSVNENLPLVLVQGQVPRGKGLPPDAKICIQCTSTMLTQFGDFGREDAGCCVIDLITIMDDWLDMGYQLNGEMVQKPLQISKDLYVTGGGIHENKGSLTIEVHSISCDTSLSIDSVKEFHNVHSNASTISTLSHNYVQLVNSEKSYFIPTALGTSLIECPLLPSEVKPVGSSPTVSSTQMVPLPTFMLFKELNLTCDFWVNLLYIMVDRDWEMMDPTEAQLSPIPGIQLFQMTSSFLSFYNTSIRNASGEKEALHFRASYMGKLIVLYVQSINYNTDKIWTNGRKENVEEFSDPLLFNTLDCEDGTRGIQRFYATFIKEPLYVKIIEDMISRGDWETTISNAASMSVSSSLGIKTKKAAILLRKLLTDKQWSFSPREEVSINIGSNVDEGGEVSVDILNVVWGSMARYFAAAILQDFHHMACHYVDVFHLFGVSQGDSQNSSPTQEDPLEAHIEEDRAKQIVLQSKQLKHSLNFEKFTLSIRNVYQVIRSAHAAAILWPYPYFRHAVSNWNVEHPLAKAEPYDTWLREHLMGDDKPIFGSINPELLPMITCEGTGMLLPGSFDDPVREVRKLVHLFPPFKRAKKALIFNYTEPHIYQSIILAMTPRFLKKYKVCSFMVTKEIRSEMSTGKDPIHDAMVRYLKEKENALQRMNSRGMAEEVLRLESRIEDVETLESISRRYIPYKSTAPQISGPPSTGRDAGEIFLSRGLPYSTVVTMDKDVQLVPFGFSTIGIKKAFVGVEFDDVLLRVMERVAKQNPLIPVLHGWQSGETNQSVFYPGLDGSKSKAYLLVEESTGGMDSILVNDRKIPVVRVMNDVTPRLSSLYSIPVEDIYRKYSHLKKLETAFTGHSNNVIKFSIFMNEEQIATEESVSSLIIEMRRYFPHNFIQRVRCKIEHLSRELTKIRVDVYVSV